MVMMAGRDIFLSGELEFCDMSIRQLLHLESGMTRVDDYLNMVDDPSRRALTPGHPADAALLALMVHVAFSDGVVAPNELAFLTKVLPGRSEAALLSWVKQEASTTLNWNALGELLSTPDERGKGFRFAVRMAWKDGTIQKEERRFLEDMAQRWALGPGVVDRVLKELRAKVSGAVDTSDLIRVIKEVQWASVQVASGPLESDLADALPAGVELVARLGLDASEMAAICKEGFAARFMEGCAFIPWSELVSYTRVSTLGASLQVHTESGRTWSLVDTRMRGLCLLFERLFREQEQRESVAPVIEQLRGGDD